MECQKCGTEIGRSNYCGCGWKKGAYVSQNNVTRDCCFEGCPNPAILSKILKTGRANLCEFHSDKLRMDEAYANLDKYGLAKLPDETQAEWIGRMREFVRSGLKKLAYRKAA